MLFFFMNKIFDELKLKAERSPKRIVFPEGNDLRILKACRFLKDNGFANPVILRGDKAEVLLEQNNLSAEGLELIKDFPINDYVDLLVEKRKSKGLLRRDALRLLEDVNYQGVLLVESGFVDAMVSGACHPTASVLRPALQIIKTKEGVNKASSFFMIFSGDNLFFFSDCAFIVRPDALDLKDIALATARSAESFGVTPRVALLSFSTSGSSNHESLLFIRDALNLIKKEDSSLIIDGELQLDAAIVPEVANLKCPNSVIKGDANVLIFPDLNSGNIGYKLVERLGGCKVVGPIIQGLRKPVNDLSRGCCVEDIINVSLITGSEVEK